MVKNKISVCTLNHSHKKLTIATSPHLLRKIIDIFFLQDINQLNLSAKQSRS